MLAPHWKKVALAPCRSRISRRRGVAGLGPSSKVRARARRPGGPWKTEGARNEELRPRTPYASTPAVVHARALPAAIHILLSLRKADRVISCHRERFGR